MKTRTASRRKALSSRNSASRASAVRGCARSPGTSTGTGPLPEVGSAPSACPPRGHGAGMQPARRSHAPGGPCRTHGRLPAAPPRRSDRMVWLMQEPVTPEDRFAIKDLLARFSWAIWSPPGKARLANCPLTETHAQRHSKKAASGTHHLRRIHEEFGADAAQPLVGGVVMQARMPVLLDQEGRDGHRARQYLQIGSPG
jgi:hypothetical protein